MIRAILTVILPLLLPTALYLLWAIAMRRATASGDALRDLPWPWLASAGLVLLIGALALATQRFGGGEKGIYVAPVAVDGKIIPGHIEPAPPPPPRP
jgi:hypothetical protein